MTTTEPMEAHGAGRFTHHIFWEIFSRVETREAASAPDSETRVFHQGTSRIIITLVRVPFKLAAGMHGENVSPELRDVDDGLVRELMNPENLLVINQAGNQTWGEGLQQ